MKRSLSFYQWKPWGCLLAIRWLRGAIFDKETRKVLATSNMLLIFVLVAAIAELLLDHNRSIVMLHLNLSQFCHGMFALQMSFVRQWHTQDLADRGGGGAQREVWGGDEDPGCCRLRRSRGYAYKFLRFSHKNTYLAHIFIEKGHAVSAVTIESIVHKCLKYRQRKNICAAYV